MDMAKSVDKRIWLVRQKNRLLDKKIDRQIKRQADMYIASKKDSPR